MAVDAKCAPCQLIRHILLLLLLLINGNLLVQGLSFREIAERVENVDSQHLREVLDIPEGTETTSTILENYYNVKKTELGNEQTSLGEDQKQKIPIALDNARILLAREMKYNSSETDQELARINTANEKDQKILFEEREMASPELADLEFLLAIGELRVNPRYWEAGEPAEGGETEEQRETRRQREENGAKAVAKLREVFIAETQKLPENGVEPEIGRLKGLQTFREGENPIKLALRLDAGAKLEDIELAWRIREQLIGGEKEPKREGLGKATAVLTEAYLLARMSHFGSLTEEERGQERGTIAAVAKVMQQQVDKEYEEMLDFKKGEDVREKYEKRTGEFNGMKAKIEELEEGKRDSEMLAFIGKAQKAIEKAKTKIEAARADEGVPEEPTAGGDQDNKTMPIGPASPEEMEEYERKRVEEVDEAECQDNAQNCHETMRLCGHRVYHKVMLDKCKRTCGVCIPKGKCKDKSEEDCKSRGQAYCDDKRYSKAMKVAQCSKFCKLC